MDEIYQCNLKDLQKLYYAKLMYGVQIIGSGAFDQVDASNNNYYDLKFNKFFTDQMFDGVLVELNYIKDSGRFKDNLDAVLIDTMETGRIQVSLKIRLLL